MMTRMRMLGRRLAQGPLLCSHACALSAQQHRSVSGCTYICSAWLKRQLYEVQLQHSTRKRLHCNKMTSW